ncbi:MAG: acetate--CoA ligase family protein [Alphaproteobacteria bacterium]|nr:acetate--CoA ligase family protein [Alphaproteobacteria bacterium]
MSLESLINPKSIAIVGVSTKKATFQVGGRAIFDHLRLHGYPHRVDLITRERTTIDGQDTYSDLSDLPETPDCIVVSVPAVDVYQTVEQGLSLGTRAFLVITGGFSESGDAGAALQTKLVDLVTSHGAVMLGPNTTGYVNFNSRIAMSSTSRITAGLPQSGEVGLIIQSGALGSAMLEHAIHDGIGLSYLISTGNEAVTDLGDYIDFLVEDANTSAIALYVEGFRRTQKVVAAAQKALAANKPILLYKTGRSDAGRRAAAGHTGALIGNRGAYDAAVRQLGWIDVRSIEDLLPTAHYLVKSRPAKTIGILTLSGGLGGCLADALEETGKVTLPAPNEKTIERMRQDIPPFLSVKNPVDIAGTPFRRAGGFAACLDAFLDDPAFDAVTIANTPIVAPWAKDVSDAVADAMTRWRAEKGGNAPISVVWPAEIFNAEALKALRQEGVPVFSRIDSFTAAVVAASSFAEARANPSRLIREGLPNLSVQGAHTINDEARNEADSKRHLKSLGFSFPAEAFLAPDDHDALCIEAQKIGYPITLKGMAEGVVHKSEYGLVAVALPNEDTLRQSLQDMSASAQKHRLSMEGFLISETVRPQTEVFLALSIDPEFGPVLTFGAGGIYTELLKDVTTRLLPLDRAEIVDMIDNCRISRILHGMRGRDALDVNALVDFIEAFTALAPRLGTDFQGVEINPIGVGKAGDGVWILDATIFGKGLTA